MKTCFIFFVRGNVMILDAMNQKQVINRYAKLDSSGFLGERERERRRGSWTKKDFFCIFFFFFFLSEKP